MVGEIEIRGVEGLGRFLRDAGKVAVLVAGRGLARCGVVALREAKANAPRSPTKEQWSATLKRKRKTDRKNFFPGGLEKSIEVETVEHIENGGGGSKSEAICRVFVRDNSFAGKYARKIHDEKGTSWKNRGPGTIAKGARADEKFIERAIRDNETAFSRILADEFDKAIRGMV